MFGGNKAKNKGDGLLGDLKMKAADKMSPNHSLCPSLTLKQRVYGWGICFGIGILLSIASCGMLRNLVRGDVVKFAVIYTLGIMCAIGSSMFLWGPKRQCKSMFDKTRRITTIIFLTCLVSIIACCVVNHWHHIPMLVFLCLVII